MIKIVIIDDDLFVAEVISDVLERNFNDVSLYTENDGDKGYDLVDLVRPDLVILDIHMPNLSGFDICQQIKKNKKLARIPVLMITGSIEVTSSKVKSLDLGAEGFINKPFEIAELIAQVKSMINLKVIEDRLVKQRDKLKKDVSVKNRELEQNYKELKLFFDGFVQVMATTIDSLSIYSFNSMKQVAELVERFIFYINENQHGFYKDVYFNDEQSDNLVTAAWLHDIGKILLPANIMNKTTRLGDSYAIVRQRFDAIYYWIKSECPEKMDQYFTAIDMINKYNDPIKMIDKEIVSYFQEIASFKYKTAVGEDKNWLTAYELECLSILQGTLTGAERKEVSKHVQLTNFLLSKISFPTNKAGIHDWCSSHHEYLDGSGYWRGLSGEEIAFETRILTIVDIYEALVSTDRPYKKKYTQEEALDYLSDYATMGKLDGELVKLFKKSKVWMSL